MVTRAEDGASLFGVSVVVPGTGLATITAPSGRYHVIGIPAGVRAVVFRSIGFKPETLAVDVPSDAAAVLDVALTSQPILLSEIVVVAVSRLPERIVEAPGAVAVVDQALAREVAIAGQPPLALQQVQGAEIVQNGVNDFNVNARGFNSSLTRRVLVLQDGRDLAMPLFGSQEWGTMTPPFEDLGRIEFVRGPGSALYGANAYSGVVAITTPHARDLRGARATVVGGGLETVRMDARVGGVLAAGRVGYRVGVAYGRSDTWSRSRTRLDGSDLAREYADATDSVVGPFIERRPLSGQRADPVTGEALGERDPIVTLAASGRLDRYAPNGSVGTFEAGVARVDNEVLVTGIGRMQIARATRPWARVAWAAEDFHLMAYWSGRTTPDSQYLLGPNLPFTERSSIAHVEGQFNRLLFGDRARLVAGASLRTQRVNTGGTLLVPDQDDRADVSYAVFGQVDYQVLPWLRAVAATRVDDGDLFDAQLSPKAAVVLTPGERHAFRFTVNQAFQTPSQLEFFGQGRIGAPANFQPIEDALRAGPLGPELAGVPNGELFTVSVAVPVLARGNSALDVERVLSWEVGYKGQLGERLFVTVDAYLARLTNFVTDLLPGVNPSYPAWTAPDAVPDTSRAAVEQAVRDALLAAGQPVAAAGLARLPDGATAVVVSPTNAGRVLERGVEIGLELRLTRALFISGNLSRLTFRVKEKALQDRLLPNSPEYIANLSVSLRGAGRIDATASAKLVGGYSWAAGALVGYVPSRQAVDLQAAYRITELLRLQLLATTIFDQRRFHLYGGSVVGRRVLAGLTATL
jgi:iron complex outermembrane receptor protein